MGNINYYNHPEFLRKYNQLQQEFKSQVSLFDMKSIEFPLSTNGMKIVDAKNRRVKLAGGNWSGAHARRHCVGGLDVRPLKQLCNEIRTKFDMNSIRLTFSLEMYYTNNVIERKYIQANPEMYGKTAMQIFDMTIEALINTGIMVYLNNHTSKSQWCCSNFDGDGLWWNQQYSEEAYFECLKGMAKRYRNQKGVIGMDLRNQIRPNGWKIPSWGDNNTKTDWRLAAQTIGNQLQSIAPHWLIIVGGIDYQKDLSGALKYPIELKIPNKLVYSGHLYNFSWGPTNLVYTFLNQQSFREKLFNTQLAVRGLGVPFLVGEFGNNSQDEYWIYFLRYLKQLDLDWTYWCLDGYKCDQKQDETYGIWNYDFSKPRNQDMLQSLKRIGRPVKGLNI